MNIFSKVNLKLDDYKTDQIYESPEATERKLLRNDKNQYYALKKLFLKFDTQLNGQLTKDENFKAFSHLG